MMKHMCQCGKFAEDALDGFSEAVLARERSMSTGMESGIAIPHAAVDGLEEIACCMSILRDEAGVNFESIDGSATRFIVLLLIPRSQKLLHIRTLADIARLLGRESVRDGLLAASTPEEALACLDAGAART